MSRPAISRPARSFQGASPSSFIYIHDLESGRARRNIAARGEMPEKRIPTRIKAKR